MAVSELLSPLSAYGQDIGAGGPIDLTAGGWGATQAPQLWGQWGQWAEGVATDANRAALSSRVEGLAAGWQGAENRWFDEAARTGLSRETASLMWGSVAPRFESQVAEQQAQSEAALGAQVGQIGTQAVGAIQSSIDYQDQLDQTNYWNQLFLDEQKKKRKWGLIGSVIGLAGSALTMGATGGFGALAGLAGGAIGGGGGYSAGTDTFNPGQGWGGGQTPTWGNY